MQYLDDTNEKEVRKEDVDIDRRKALAKLGFMAVAAYAAPLLLKISDAHAKGSGGSGGSGGGSGGDHGGGSGASGASGGTGASSASGASGATGATGATGASGSNFSSSQGSGRGSDSDELTNPNGIDGGIEGGV